MNSTSDKPTSRATLTRSHRRKAAPEPEVAPEPEATSTWTRQQAESLRSDGYSLDYIERRTGIRLRK